jgi:hypothetical protein
MKQLTADDFYIRPFITTRSSRVDYTHLSGSFPVRFDEADEFDPYTFNVNASPINPSGIYKSLLGRSVQQIFYNVNPTANYKNHLLKNTISGSFYVLNIPQRFYGERVLPGSLHLFDITSPIEYIDDGQGQLLVSGTNIFVGNIFYDVGIAIIKKTLSPTGPVAISGPYFNASFFPRSYFNEFFRSEETGSMLSLSSSLANGFFLPSYFNQRYFSTYYGNNLYVLPTSSFATLNSDGMYLTELTTVSVVFKSQHTIYEHNIQCTVDPNEFNYSVNPTMMSNSLDINSLPNLRASGSITPYITTVGCYNDKGELLLVAKFPRPIKRLPSTQQTFIIRVDI